VSEDKLKIVTTPQDYGGAGWYRVKQFNRVANELDIANVRELEPKFSDRVIEKMFENCDVFHVRFRSESIVNLVRLFKNKYPEKLFVFDTDDDLHNTSPLNSAYERFGTEEVQLDDGKLLWQHGKAKLDLYENRHRMVDYEYCLEQADAVITTTMTLKRKLEKWNDTVVVVPNAIWFDYWPKLDIRKEDKDEVRMLWQGGSSHFEDLQMVKPQIDKLMNKYKKLKFILVGQAFPYIVKDIPEDRLEVYNWIKCDGHGYRMACVDADIGLAPLRDTEFNRNKSCLKFYEYSALKTATVASNVVPYNYEIDDGTTGLLFNEPEEMVEQVSELVEDPIRRMELASNAHDWVKRNRDVKEVVKDWVEFMEKASKAKKGEFEPEEDSKLEVVK
jgi:glycosyltransferase involved in cell wall biosynthesis